MDELTQRGISALKSGDRASARQLLTAAVKQDPNNGLAWLWLTGALDSDDERLACLRQVLRIDPNNAAAARGMAQILERRNRSATAPQPVSQPDEPAPARATETPPVAASPVIAPAEPAVEADPIPAAQPQPENLPAPEGAPAAVESVPSAGTAGETDPNLPAAEAVPEPKPARRRVSRPAAESGERPVFRSRPSLVPALLCFWVFLFGAIGVGALLSGAPEVALPLAAGLGLILEVVVIYTIIRTMGVRYELTNRHLTLPFNGKRARIPIKNVYNAEITQTFWQRMIGIGHIDVDASINGQLAHVRMRNVPQVRMRTDQIMYLVRDHAAS